MPINVKIEKSQFPHRKEMYVVKVMSGYRQGSLLVNSADYPQHFSSVRQATQWLVDTGYTIVN